MPASHPHSRSPRLAGPLAALFACAAIGLAAVMPAGAAGRRPVATTRSAPPLSSAQTHYLALAEAGVQAAETDWANHAHHWYNATLDDPAQYPLATIWDAVPLFEAIDAIAIAQPSPAHLEAVTTFANGAEAYLNHGLKPVPGYSPYPGDRSANTETWFDDNGWWGLAFVNAFRATGKSRYLLDAERALGYIAAAGWDPSGGGIWWNTDHPYKAGEALASGTLLATLLYEQTHSATYLADANMFLAWGNAQGFSAVDGLYAESDRVGTPEDYVEAPLIYAQQVLCTTAGATSDCAHASTLTNTALRRFGTTLDFGPQYDAIYLQWLLALYGSDGDTRLYDLAASNANTAAAEARNSDGLYLRSWQGQSLGSRVIEPNMLQTQSATTSLFAWLAVYPPPPGE